MKHGKRHLEITAGETSRDAKVYLDGKDIAPLISELRLTMAVGEPNRVYLTLAVPAADLDLDVDVDTIVFEWKTST